MTFIILIRVIKGEVFLIIIFLNKIIFTKYKFESNRYSHQFLLLLYYIIILLYFKILVVTHLVFIIIILLYL